MTPEQHPFNDNYGIKSIGDRTTKLILGTFPAYQVTANKGPRINFYYGSTDNKFWDLFKKVKNPQLELTSESILKYLIQEGYGIIDIVQSCYRKNGVLSSDVDLDILEKQDLIKILIESNIDTIYSTSKMVTDLLKEQLYLALPKGHGVFGRVIEGDYWYQEILLPGQMFKNERRMKIVTLYSPSPNGLRGLKKGINSKGLIIEPEEYRLNQYRQFLQ